MPKLMLTEGEINDFAARIELEGFPGAASDLRCVTDQDSQRTIMKETADRIESEGRYNDHISRNTIRFLRHAAADLERED